MTKDSFGTFVASQGLVGHRASSLEAPRSNIYMALINFKNTLDIKKESSCSHLVFYSGF